MATPTLEQLKRALHISEAIEKLQAEMASIFTTVGVKALGIAESGMKAATRMIGGAKKKRTISASHRAAIVKAQKAKWKKVKGKTSKPAAAKEKPAKQRKKGKMSAAGRANIVAAQKARWAKVKAEKAGKKA